MMGWGGAYGDLVVGGGQSSWSDRVRLVVGLWELRSEGLVNERGNQEEESEDFVRTGKEAQHHRRLEGRSRKELYTEDHEKEV